jgi:hypothetical protein
MIDALENWNVKLEAKGPSTDDVLRRALEKYADVALDEGRFEGDALVWANHTTVREVCATTDDVQVLAALCRLFALNLRETEAWGSRVRYARL